MCEEALTVLIFSSHAQASAHVHDNFLPTCVYCTYGICNLLLLLYHYDIEESRHNDGEEKPPKAHGKKMSDSKIEAYAPQYATAGL